MERTKRPRSRAQWEELLAREGLAPLDRDGEMLPSHDAEERPRLGELVEAWLAWAREVADTFEFRERKDREVWRLLAGGMSRRKIAQIRTVSLAQINSLVRRVERWCPIQPPRNPWFRGGSERKDDDMRAEDDEDLTTVVARDPAAAADMLKEATLYIEDLGDEYMDEFKARIGASDFDTDNYQQYGIAGEFQTPETNVWLTTDGVPSKTLSGEARSLTAEEIAKLNLTPPRKS